MGRFSHEAVAVDPARRASSTRPRTPAALRLLPLRAAPAGHLAAGGTLQMLAVDGQPQLRHAASARRRTSRWTSTGSTIDKPDPGARRREPSVFAQGMRQGRRPPSRGSRAPGTATARSTSFHQRRQRRAGAGLGVRPDRARRCGCCSSRRRAEVLNAPDNICVSPRGGLVLCEDGSGAEFLHGLTADGDDLPVRAEQRRPAPASATASPATSAAASSPARATARTAAGSSSTSRRPASRSRSPAPGATAPSDVI